MSAIITLLDGRVIDILDPKPEDIKIEDIANALSKLCRFNGIIKDFYSVAQHCCSCVDMAVSEGVSDKKKLLALLLHDASEAYCGDVIRPLKVLLGETYSIIEGRFEDVIEKALNVEIYRNKEFIKNYDNRIIYREKQLKDSVRFVCWDHNRSYLEYMNYYKGLTNE